MDELSWGRLVALSVTAGASLALGVMGALALRTVWSVSRGRRWYQLKRL